MKTPVPLALGLTLALAACGGGSQAPATTPGPVVVTPAPITTTGGGVIATAPLSTATLDRSALTATSSAANLRIQNNVALLALGSGFGYAGFSPLSTGHAAFQQALTPDLSALGITPQPADPCTFSAPDTTDGDRDGIYRNSTQMYDCTLVSSGVNSFNVLYKGSWNITDKNDADPRSGYTYDFSNRTAVDGTSAGTTVNAVLTSNFLLDVDPTAAGGVKARYLLDYGVKGTGINGTQSQNIDARWLMALNMESTPDADTKGVTVKFSGSASTNGLSGGVAAGPAGALSFSGNLHYSRTCSGIDSGSVTYTSGVNTVTYTYSGCNIVTVK